MHQPVADGAAAPGPAVGGVGAVHGEVAEAHARLPAPGPRHSNSQNPMCRHITSHQHITAGINGVISLCPAPSPVGFSILPSILQRIHYTNRTSVNGEGFANKHPSLNNVETKYTHPLKICAFIRVLMYKLRTTIHSPAATPLICPDSAPPTGARGRSLHLGTVILGEI